MRYSIMLQIVAGITVVLVSAAALFAWIQNRTSTSDLGRSISPSVKQYSDPK